MNGNETYLLAPSESWRERRSFWTGALRVALLLTLLARAPVTFAETRFPPPEFESGYQMPATQHPAPRGLWLEYVDVFVLAAVLGAATWVVHKKRSRRWVIELTIFTVLYFGFYREGCVCAIGSVQNVALGLCNNGYAVPLGVLAFFALPLVTALFFGRTFCAAACPHGALQDLILLKAVQVPAWLERGLGVIPFVYLGLAVLFAATGSAFIICQYDPFIPIFRLSGSTTALAIGAGFLATGVFVGRPYCRFLCPYGALLKIAASVSKWRVRITPDLCTQCTLCAESCPFGVIRQPAAGPPTSGLLSAARKQFAWLLLALPLLVAAGVLAGGRFGDAVAGVNPDVRIAALHQKRVAGKVLVLTRLEELELARAESAPRELLADAEQARRWFHIGGWLFGGWFGLIVGFKLLGVAGSRQGHDFEPERSACFGCARCFEFCPQEQVRLGAIKLPCDAISDTGLTTRTPTGRAANGETAVKT